MPGSAPRVLVTDAGRGSAIAIIRSLGRRGWHVVAADADRRSPGFYSRYTSAKATYPLPSVDAEAMVARLQQIARHRRVDLIFPVTDEVILPLSRYRDRFEEIAPIAMPDSRRLALAADKRATLELAAELGVPTPPTAVVRTTGEAIRCVRSRGTWPVVLKPATSRVYVPGKGVLSFAVTYANNEQQLRNEMERFEGRCEVLLQDYYHGEGQGVELLLDRGRPVAAFQHRRIREVPVTGGASSFRESVPLDPELLHHSLRILGALDWSGLAMVEFKIGAAGPKLMEVNGRVWGSLPLAVRCGVDFPVMAAEMHAFGRVRSAPPAGYPNGIRSSNLELDLVWIGSVLGQRQRYRFLPGPRRREAVGAVATLLDSHNGFDILSRRDPGPGLAEIGKIVRTLRRKLREAR